MRYIFTTMLVLITMSAQSQLLEGPIVIEKRALLTPTDFKIISSQYQGAMVFEIYVTNEGSVEREVYLEGRSQFYSTPALVQAKNYLKTLKFQKGTHFEKLHRVTVRVTFVKQP